METFWFFWLRFSRAYDSDFLFLLRHKRSYGFAYDSDSVASDISVGCPESDGRKLRMRLRASNGDTIHHDSNETSFEEILLLGTLTKEIWLFLETFKFVTHCWDC